MNESMANLEKGAWAVISGYTLGSSAYRAKLLALGLTRGTEVKIINIAPLGDPMELAVRGYHLSLRRKECEVIKVRRLDQDGAKSQTKGCCHE